MNIVVVVVYDRLDNIKHWIHCWQQCDKTAELIIIHNSDGVTWDINGVTYIKRKWGGYDIGALQDVCMERLKGFNNKWEKMLWVTDDTIPMCTNFADKFFSQLINNTGCVAMEISPFVKTHIRTTGFAITKEVANKLMFPRDPVTTKEDCYKFEHRGNTLLDQITAMGLKSIMVTPREISPLFDTGYTRRLKNRINDHYKIFGDNPTLPNFSRQTVTMLEQVEKGDGVVSFICPVYDKYPQIISSLLCQTYTDWKLYLIHDGPTEFDIPDDPRIIYERVKRVGNDWGHSLRAQWLQKMRSEFIVITNADNYYMPTFLLKAVTAIGNNIAVYCSQIIHSYTDYKVMDCRLQRGYIDCGQVLLRTKEAASVGWNSREHSADWFFFNDIILKYSAKKFIPFKGCLFVHN